MRIGLAQGLVRLADCRLIFRGPLVISTERAVTLVPTAILKNVTKTIYILPMITWTLHYNFLLP